VASDYESSFEKFAGEIWGGHVSEFFNKIGESLPIPDPDRERPQCSGERTCATNGNFRRMRG
jgi:hypothetical protein